MVRAIAAASSTVSPCECKRVNFFKSRFSLEDFQSLEETAYLLRNPANAKRLLGAIEQLEAGKGTERKLQK